MENDQKVNIVDEANYAKVLLDSVNDQIARLERAGEELSSTLAILRDDGIGVSKDVRVSIGSGIFVSAKGIEFDKVLFPLGSGVLKEEPREKARQMIEDNLKDIQGSLNSLYVRKKDVETRYESLLTILQNSSGKSTGTVNA
ncbi:MAG: prefoldin subunit alpha [Candidatus Thermoplasmatota archaeon]|nr:prefoldin subunit alpha [Candidatus Thermoplasmatota archaeon]